MVEVLVSGEWKPIDNEARDGGLWPVATKGVRGLARYRNGGWEYLVHIPGHDSAPLFLRNKDATQDPDYYFDIPEPPQ